MQRAPKMLWGREADYEIFITAAFLDGGGKQVVLLAWSPQTGQILPAEAYSCECRCCWDYFIFRNSISKVQTLRTAAF